MLSTLKKSLFLFLLFYTSVGFGQQAKIDSLKQALDTSKKESQRVDIYSKLTKIYWNRNLDSANYFNQQVLKIVTKKDLSLFFTAKTREEFIQSSKGEVEKANTILDRLFSTVENAKDTALILYLYESKAKIKANSMDYDSAMHYFNKGLTLGNNFPHEQGRAYTNLATLFILKKIYLKL